MPNNSKISAVLISFNEEKYIGQCLKSLQEVADEIVVVDSFSTDKTKSICEEHGARFISREWQGYSATKNFANEQAKHDYVLSVDADEVLSDELISSIKETKYSGLSPLSVYSFNRLNNYCGQWIKHAGWYPDTKVRLFAKQSTRWEGEVHEKLVFAQNPSVVKLQGDLLHYSIESKQDHIQREKKYASLAKKYPNRFAAWMAAIFKFFKMYILKLGFLEGKLGFQLCLISAKSKLWR